uniref:G patch domain-containing protein 11 n=1 Tax=Lygus hesperus TaxID=30085 RepID=A0A0A9W587_LYGHE
MSDDEDYMSDAFLTAAANNDIRPGLLHSHSQRRNHELWKKKGSVQEQESRKPTATLELEARKDGLDKPIAQDNKGFAMMSKMGFNPGAGLGRHGQGRVEPIGIEVKTDKQGLGRKAVVQELLERKRKMLENHRKNALSVEDFRASMSEKAQEKQTNLDLMKSQRVCHTMDQDWGIEEPEEKWFWPEFAREESEEEEDDEGSEEHDMEEELTPKEKLELLTMYLRRTHYFCIWCGVKYQDDDDIRDCPGPTRYDHDV